VLLGFDNLLKGSDFSSISSQRTSCTFLQCWAELKTIILSNGHVASVIALTLFCGNNKSASCYVLSPITSSGSPEYHVASKTAYLILLETKKVT